MNKKEGTNVLSYLPKVIQLISEWIEIQTKDYLSPKSQIFFHYITFDVTFIKYRFRETIKKASQSFFLIYFKIHSDLSCQSQSV